MGKSKKSKGKKGKKGKKGSKKKRVEEPEEPPPPPDLVCKNHDIYLYTSDKCTSIYTDACFSLTIISTRILLSTFVERT